MLIKKSQTQKKSASADCTVWEYEFPSNNFSLATSLINGRYPDAGKVVNEQCEEIYYCLAGSGIIHSDQGDFEITVGDAYHFALNESYYIQGNNLTIALINAPKWTPEQHKNIN